MSLASKITLGATTVAVTGIIYFVQAKQSNDRERMHEGVIRDKERREKREADNLYLLQQQEELTKALRNKSDEEEAVLKILADATDEKD